MSKFPSLLNRRSLLTPLSPDDPPLAYKRGRSVAARMSQILQKFGPAEFQNNFMAISALKQ
jgi:hypothetical protein